MGDIAKVKLMDSGTARFRAAGLDDAMRKVRAVLSIYGSVSGERNTDRNVERNAEVNAMEQAEMILDCSDSIYNQFVTVKLERTSTEGEWAASFREGNSATTLGYILLRLGAHSACHRRMQAIIESLDNLQQ